MRVSIVNVFSISLVLISAPLYDAQNSQFGNSRTTYRGDPQTVLGLNPKDYYGQNIALTPYLNNQALNTYNGQQGCRINENCCPCQVQPQGNQVPSNAFIPLQAQAPTVPAADEDDYQITYDSQSDGLANSQNRPTNVDSSFGNGQNRPSDVNTGSGIGQNLQGDGNRFGSSQNRPGDGNRFGINQNRRNDENTGFGITQNQPGNSQQGSENNNKRRRPETPTPAPVVIAPQSVAMTKFGVKLFKLLNRPGNTVVSPLSVATTLALLQQGAKGQTLQELNAALLMDPRQALNSYGRTAESLSPEQSSILEVVSKVLITNQFSIIGDFQRIAKENFGSEIEKIHPETIERDRAQINRWVANKTHNYIQQLLQPGAISENSQLVLVNAVYFKGFWKRVFDTRNTGKLDFHLSNGLTKPAQFMRMRELFQAGSDEQTGAKVLLLPFKDDKYSLMVILPEKLQDMDRIIASLDDESRLLGYLNLPETEVRLTIPKFNLKTKSDLKEPFKKMGIEQLFTYRTDLSGIAVEPLPGVTSAIHTAVLTIDEQGGTGAASTLINVETLSAIDRTITFTADRPFLAVVWEQKPVARPLFIAKIEDPTATVRF